MKKIYLVCGLALFLGITAGISFFLIRDANAKIPSNIYLTDQNGQQYSLGQDMNKLKLVEFIYTHCPDICPTTTKKMSELKKSLEKSGVFGKDIEFLTISIDPYRDTPQILKGYMKGFGIKDDGNWEFLTGDRKNIKNDRNKIEQIANSLQFQFKDPGNGEYIHSAFIYLVDKNNKFIAKYPMGDNFNKQDIYNKVLESIK